MICFASLPLVQLIERYRNYKLECGVGAAEQLQVTARLYGKYLQQLATVDDLNKESIAKFLRWLLNEGRSPGTVKSKRQHLRQLWRFARQLRLADKVPRQLPEIRDPEGEPVSWEPEQLEQLLPLARSWKRQRASKANRWWSGRWMECLLLVLYETGERIGALRKLKRTSFVRETGSLYVPCTARKAKRKTRHYALRPTTAALLSSLLDEVPEAECELLFPYLGETKSLRKILTDVLLQAGLPADRSSKFHRFRRTHGTLIAVATDEEAARKALGHSSAKTTARYVNRKALPPSRWCDVLPRLNYGDARQKELF
jgi:integrase